MGATITVDGAGRLRTKLNGGKFLIQPVGDSVKVLTRHAESLAKKRAPRGETGATVDAITSRTYQGKRGPAGIVALKAVTDEGTAFRYAFALDAAKQRNTTGRKLTRAQRQARAPKRVTKANAPYTYRKGESAGKPTHRWFHGTSALMKRRLRAEAKKLAGQVRRGWEKR